MNKLLRTVKATFWYWVVMWAGIGYFLYSPLPDWQWYIGMVVSALVLWLGISKLRQIIHF